MTYPSSVEARREVDRLEGQASEILQLIRSIRNTSAPINKFPEELLSRIPPCWDEKCMKNNLIAMTHVCQRWRAALTACTSFWTRLTFTHLEETRVYLRRSQSSPLHIELRATEGSCYLEGALALVAPHIHRISSITLRGGYSLLRDFSRHFSSIPIAPALELLRIRLEADPIPALDDGIFPAQLPLLRELCLSGITLHPRWQNLQNLSTLSLGGGWISGEHTNTPSITQLLDTFEQAPSLRKVEIFSAPSSSDTPASRVVHLARLEKLVLCTDRNSPSILLEHLGIPRLARLLLEFEFDGDESPLPWALPGTTRHLQNINHINSIYLSLHDTHFVLRLTGPSGGLEIYGYQEDTPSYANRILRSLSFFPLSTIHQLAVTYRFPMDATTQNSLVRLLEAMKGLRTLLLRGDPGPCIRALKNDPERVACPNLENLILSQDYVTIADLDHLGGFDSSSGASFPSVRVISQDDTVTDGYRWVQPVHLQSEAMAQPL